MQNSLIINKNTNLAQNKIEEFESYTIIEINKKIYGIRTLDVLEITKLMELDFPSSLPSCILGTTKYDKTPVGVIDLREVFKDERIVYDLAAKIVIVKTKNEKIPYCSFICDNVLDIKKIPKKEIRSTPYNDGKDFYCGIYVRNNEDIKKQDNIYLINFENIIKYIARNIDKYQPDTKRYIVDDENSLKTLKKRKDFLSKIEQDTQKKEFLFDMGITFVVNDIRYYINMASVKEFYKINNDKFIKVPNTPDYVFGLINIKGEYITVIDIRKFFNSPKTTLKEKSTIIILNSPEFKIGILADEICESMNVDFEEISQNRVQKQDDNKCLEFVKNGEIYQVIDMEQLFKDERLTIC